MPHAPAGGMRRATRGRPLWACCMHSWNEAAARGPLQYAVVTHRYTAAVTHRYTAGPLQHAACRNAAGAARLLVQSRTSELFLASIGSNRAEAICCGPSSCSRDICRNAACGRKGPEGGGSERRERSRSREMREMTRDRGWREEEAAAQDEVIGWAAGTARRLVTIALVSVVVPPSLVDDR